jgi:hypothetical protein
MPVLPLVVDCDDGEKSRRQQLLAVHALRRGLERVACADGRVSETPLAVRRASVARQLLELIAALDRRVPQVQRAGEAAIADDGGILIRRPRAQR